MEKIKNVLKKAWDAKWKIILGALFIVIIAGVCCGVTMLFPIYSITAGLIGTVFGLTIFITYLVAVWWNNGVLKSISISYYYDDPRWLFQVFMFGAAFCILLIGQCWWSALVAFLFGVMTLNPSVTGGNIYFIPHMVSAISAITIANISLWVLYGLWWMCLGLVVAILLILMFTRNRNVEQHPAFNEKNWLYWVEVVSISTYFLGLIIGCILPCFI